VPGERIDRAALAELARSRGWPGPEEETSGPGDDPA
jgi:hypothetical protein